APDPEPQWHFPRNVTDELPARSPYPRRRTTTRDPGPVILGFPADDDLELDPPDGPILLKQTGYSGGWPYGTSRGRSGQSGLGSFRGRGSSLSASRGVSSIGSLRGGVSGGRR